MQNLYEKIESLSFDEFEALLRFIDKTRKERAKAILAEAQKQAARLTQEVDIAGSKKGTKPAKPAKYRDPQDPNNTWSGYGRQPDWMKDHIANGGDKEDLLIG
ncbi:H-NS histone family protein [Cardiobacteriaceae bacterium TAE3-ERU3]|nr:H-NS histone family protein [Cardiobacteriaceae bacterium TAE3-ERU3]